MLLLLIGCAGFIGSNFVHAWLSPSNETIVNLYKQTYAGNLENLKVFDGDSRQVFCQGNICDRTLVSNWNTLM